MKSPHGREPGRLRVVLADDAPDVRRLMRLRLSMSGEFEIVAEASNGLEAVSRAEEQHPDLVVLDVTMPVLSGIDAIPLIRACSPATRIVVFSAEDSELSSSDALSKGADAFMSKTTPVRAVLDGLRQLFGRGPTTEW